MSCRRREFLVSTVHAPSLGCWLLVCSSFYWLFGLESFLVAHRRSTTPLLLSPPPLCFHRNGLPPRTLRRFVALSAEIFLIVVELGFCSDSFMKLLIVVFDLTSTFTLFASLQIREPFHGVSDSLHFSVGMTEDLFSPVFQDLRCATTTCFNPPTMLPLSPISLLHRRHCLGSVCVEDRMLGFPYVGLSCLGPSDLLLESDFKCGGPRFSSRPISITISISTKFFCYWSRHRLSNCRGRFSNPMLASLQDLVEFYLVARENRCRECAPSLLQVTWSDLLLSHFSSYTLSYEPSLLNVRHSLLIGRGHQISFVSISLGWLGSDKYLTLVHGVSFCVQSEVRKTSRLGLVSPSSGRMWCIDLHQIEVSYLSSCYLVISLKTLLNLGCLVIVHPRQFWNYSWVALSMCVRRRIDMGLISAASISSKSAVCLGCPLL